MTCSCEFTADNIVEEMFSSCRTSTVNTIVYRAKVNLQVPVLEMDAKDIVEIISSWLQSAPYLVVNGLRVRIDPSCPTVLKSYDEEDCFEMSTTASSSSVANEDNSKSSFGIIVGASAAAVVFIILIVVITTLHCKLKSSYR